MKKSALFFDIDGTLLSEVTKKIPVSAINAMKAAKKAGHMLFINTGRTICNIPAELRQFDFDGFLCGCGTALVYHDELLFSSSIEEIRGKKIIDKMMKCNLEGLAEGMDDVYLPSRISRFDRLESSRRYFRNAGLGLENYLENGRFIYDKLFVYADKQSDRKTFFDFISEDMEILTRGGDTYECIQKGYSKATACDFIAQKFNLDREQVYVFGDSTNDISMFEYAVHTVAMGNHAAELDPYTEFVTSEVEEDGISNAISHYNLL